MITQQELLTLFNMGTCVRTPDKFLIHTSTGRLVEVSAEAVRAYLKRDFNGGLSIDSSGNVYIDDEPTGYKLQPVNITDIESRLDGLETDLADFLTNGVSCQCADYGDHLESPDDNTLIKVKQGTDLKHISLLDIKNYLSDEYAPLWTDATVTVGFADGFSSIMEMGSPHLTSSSFVISGTPASATSVTATATGGSATTDNVSISYDDTTNILTATITRTYAAGTDQVKSSKGLLTYHTADNDTTLCAFAPINPRVNQSAYNIMQITKTATIDIPYVYAIYANALDITDVAPLPLTTEDTLTIFFPAETKTDKHTFDIPASMTVSDTLISPVRLSEFGLLTPPSSTDLGGVSPSAPVPGAFASGSTYAGTWVTTPVIHQDASGTDVQYTRYTRQDGTNGPTLFTIKLTK